MDWNLVIQAVSTLGFPIIMCGAMGWYVKYINDQNRKEIADLNEQHQKEMTDVTTAINNNTLALTKLCEKIGKEGSI